MFSAAAKNYVSTCRGLQLLLVVPPLKISSFFFPIFFFQVLFLPLSNTIVTCFKDDSLFVWDSETLKCKFQLPVPPDESKQPHYRALATPKDGRLLVAGGRWVPFVVLITFCMA